MLCKRTLQVWIFCISVLCSLCYFSSAQTLSNSTSCSTNATSSSTNYSQCLEEELLYDSCPDPSLCEVSNSYDNVGLAFGLTIGAGLSTTLGALLPFIPCIKRSNTLYLAAGLALAAGVMLYVSFTEIWNKAKWNFCCESPTHYDLVTTVCFFAGILMTVILDLLVTLLQRVDCGCRLTCLTKGPCWKRSGDEEAEQKRHPLSIPNPLRHRHSVNGIKHYSNELISPPSNSYSSEPSTTDSIHHDQDSETDKEMNFPTEHGRDNQVTPSNEGNDDTASHGPSIGTCTSVLPSNNEQPISDGRNGHVTTPECISMSVHSTGVSESTNNYGGASVNELFSNSSLLRMNAVIPEVVDGGGDSAVDMSADGISQTTSSSIGVSLQSEKVSEPVRRHSYLEMVDQVHESFESQGPEEFKAVTEGLGKDAKKLHRMGILTGLAIAIHNFPEGLATFVATLSSPSLGVALCIAIAFHNIPEGVCVAMPVYYATGKRWKGFLWAFLSGISEPLGALLGWLVLKDSFGPLVYGITFGLISGMMVYISLKELLPTARKFDTTKGPLVNIFIVTGMVVMALSLVLFLY